MARWYQRKPGLLANGLYFRETEASKFPVARVHVLCGDTSIKDTPAKEFTMRFVRLSKSHVQPVFALGKRCFGLKSEYSWDWSRAKIKEYLSPRFGVGIVCMDGDAVAGFVLIQREYSSQRPDVAWLNYILVDKKFRHAQLGSRLLEKGIAAVAKLGKRRLIADVYSKNKASIKFFKKHNLAITEQWVTLARKI